MDVSCGEQTVSIYGANGGISYLIGKTCLVEVNNVSSNVNLIGVAAEYDCLFFCKFKVVGGCVVSIYSVANCIVETGNGHTGLPAADPSIGGFVSCDVGIFNLLVALHAFAVLCEEVVGGAVS